HLFQDAVLSIYDKIFLRPPPPATSSLFPYPTLFRSSLMVGSRSGGGRPAGRRGRVGRSQPLVEHPVEGAVVGVAPGRARWRLGGDRKSTRLNSSHVKISYAVFCLKKKTEIIHKPRVL